MGVNFIDSHRRTNAHTVNIKCKFIFDVIIQCKLYRKSITVNTGENINGLIKISYNILAVQLNR